MNIVPKWVIAKTDVEYMVDIFPDTAKHIIEALLSEEGNAKRLKLGYSIEELECLRDCVEGKLHECHRDRL
jgi:hypothetical protein